MLHYIITKQLMVVPFFFSSSSYLETLLGIVLHCIKFLFCAITVKKDVILRNMVNLDNQMPLFIELSDP